MKTTAIELLEARIAPAALFTFTDIDGDLVTVKSSVGTLNDLAAAATIDNGVLKKLDVSDPKFKGAEIKITAEPKAGEISDGLASVGFIDATNTDLTSVIIDGDLGRIIVGDGDKATPAITLLKVGSLGALDLSTQLMGGNLVSTLTGPVGAIVVKGDWINATVNVPGNSAIAKDAQVGRVSIGGHMLATSGAPDSARLTVEDGIGSFSLRGDLRANAGIGSGCLAVGDEIGKLFIGGSLFGASLNSGSITADNILEGVIGGDLRGGGSDGSGNISVANLGSLTVGGSLLGTNDFSARISVTGNAGTIHVGGSFVGGTIVGESTNSGTVNIGGKLGGISVGGSLRGGVGSLSGNINVGGDIGSVTIAGDLIGGGVANTGDVTSLGSIQSVSVGGNVAGGAAAFSGRIIAGANFTPGGSLGSVSIGGSLLGGGGTDSGVIFATARIGSVAIADNVVAGLGSGAASIRAGFNIGSLTVGGQVDGTFGQQILFVASGAKTPAPGNDLAFGKVRIGGSMIGAAILAGYRAGDLAPINGDAQIGTVKIKGDFADSSIVAGVKNDDGNANNFYFGDADDLSIGAGSSATIASIAKVVIGGTVRGTVATQDPTDFHAIVAEEVRLLIIGGTTIPLKAGAHNDPMGGIGNGFLGYTGDVRVREI